MEAIRAKFEGAQIRRARERQRQRRRRGSRGRGKRGPDARHTRRQRVVACDRAGGRRAPCQYVTGRSRVGHRRARAAARGPAGAGAPGTAVVGHRPGNRPAGAVGTAGRRRALHRHRQGNAGPLRDRWQEPQCCPGHARAAGSAAHYLSKKRGSVQRHVCQPDGAGTGITRGAARRSYRGHPHARPGIHPGRMDHRRDVEEHPGALQLFRAASRENSQLCSQVEGRGRGDLPAVP